MDLRNIKLFSYDCLKVISCTAGLSTIGLIIFSIMQDKTFIYTLTCAPISCSFCAGSLALTLIVFLLKECIKKNKNEKAKVVKKEYPMFEWRGKINESIVNQPWLQPPLADYLDKAPVKKFHFNSKVQVFVKTECEVSFEDGFLKMNNKSCKRGHTLYNLQLKALLGVKTILIEKRPHHDQVVITEIYDIGLKERLLLDKEGNIQPYNK